MSKSAAVKECDIFTKARKPGLRSANTLSSSEDAGDRSMANMTDVLTELKALRSDFGVKLDGINNRLGELTNSMSVLESRVGEIKREVTANEKRIDETEARISAAEDMLKKTETALETATKRLAHLEEKAEDLENRGRRKNIRLFGLKEGAEGNRVLLDFVHDMLPQWLDTGDNRVFTLERAHRTLAPANPNYSRAVLIRFHKFQDREFVLRATRQRNITHDGSKLIFAQDFSAETI